MQLLRSAALITLSILGASLTTPTTMAASGPVADVDPPISCEVTRRPDNSFVPPKPYPEHPDDGRFWFGTTKLWTKLNADGKWHGLHQESGYREKLAWYSEGYDWRAKTNPRLIIVGKRTDAGAPPFVTYGNASWASYSFMMSGITIPTAGCWELTGDYKGQKLSFVVWVAP